MSETAPMDDTIRFIETIFEPDQVIEVRVIRENNNISCGYFTDRDSLYKSVSELDNDSTIKGIYVVMNEFRKDIIQERGQNQINRIGKGLATKDSDITKRRWLVLDFDPIKATTLADSASTDEEKAKTLEQAKKCVEYLTSKYNFPEPIYGDSGNGTHITYRIDLNNDEPGKCYCKELLIELADKFEGLDITMFNASRIVKLPGTMTRKGLNSEERPHRRSHIISLPKEIRIVDDKQLLSAISSCDVEGPYNKDEEIKILDDPKKKKNDVVILPPIEGIVSRHTDLFKPLVASMVARHNSHAAILAACCFCFC